MRWELGVFRVPGKFKWSPFGQTRKSFALSPSRSTQVPSFITRKQAWERWLHHRICQVAHVRYESCAACPLAGISNGPPSGTALDGANQPGSASAARKDTGGRRIFLKLAAAIATGLAILPFLPSGRFLLPPLPGKAGRKKIGNVQDLPDNSYQIFYYPSEADPEFTNLLIHLPKDLANEAGREHIAFNRTCIHLRCLVSYLPTARIIGCPCHGSLYRPTDGWPVGGPARLIGRYLPQVTLEIDEKGDIYAVDLNLEQIGYGREP